MAPTRLKLLVLVLVLSNVSIGIYAFTALRALDRKYSFLVAGAVPALNQLQSLTVGAGEAMHRTNPTRLGASAREEVIESARQAIASDVLRRKEVLKVVPGYVSAENAKALAAAGESFTHEACQFVDAAVTSLAPNASELRETTVRPAFNQYLAVVGMVSDELRAASLRKSNDLTTQTGSVSRMILAAGQWPLALTALFFLASACVLIFVARASLFMPEEHWRS